MWSQRSWDRIPARPFWQKYFGKRALGTGSDDPSHWYHFPGTGWKNRYQRPSSTGAKGLFSSSVLSLAMSCPPTILDMITWSWWHCDSPRVSWGLMMRSGVLAEVLIRPHLPASQYGTAMPAPSSPGQCRGDLHLLIRVIRVISCRDDPLPPLPSYA